MCRLVDQDKMNGQLQIVLLQAALDLVISNLDVLVVVNVTIAPLTTEIMIGILLKTLDLGQILTTASSHRHPDHTSVLCLLAMTPGLFLLVENLTIDLAMPLLLQWMTVALSLVRWDTPTNLGMVVLEEITGAGIGITNDVILIVLWIGCMKGTEIGM
jgi:hypothetical protein